MYREGEGLKFSKSLEIGGGGVQFSNTVHLFGCCFKGGG